MRCEQPLQVERGLGEPRHRKGDVLDDDGGARPRASRRPTETCPCARSRSARIPAGRSRSARARSVRDAGERRLDRARPARRAPSPSAARVSTSSAAPSGPDARACDSGRPGLPSTERSAARSASSTAATGALFSTRHRAAGGFEIVEQDQRARLVGVLGHGAIGDLADEAERAFGADHQVREDVDRVGEVDQRVEAVAGRVLHPELVADARGQRFVGARGSAERVELAHELALARAERRAARRHRACRARCRRRARRASRPACGSCSARCRSTCRSRCWRRCRRSSRRRSTPDPGRSCGRSGASRAVGGGADDARLQRDRRAAVAPTSQRRQSSPSSISTESVIAWPERLVPAARNVTGVCEPRAAREQPHHLVLAVDHHDDLRHQPVEARVGAPGQQAQRIGDEPLGGMNAAGLAADASYGGGRVAPRCARSNGGGIDAASGGAGAQCTTSAVNG